MSSSGFVSGPSSKREANVKGPVKRPFPTVIVPLPPLRSPSHCAVELRIAMSNYLRGALRTLSRRAPQALLRGSRRLGRSCAFGGTRGFSAGRRLAFDRYALDFRRIDRFIAADLDAR